MSMSLHKNRMHAVFDCMGRHLEQQLGKRIFKIETVLANPYQAGRVFAGGVDETRQAAMEVLNAVHQPRRTAGESVDVVVYGVPAWSPYAAFATMNPILTLISSGLGYLGGYIEALGKPGVLQSLSKAGVFEALGRPGVFEALARPGAFEALGKPGVFEALGKPGVFEALSKPGVFEALGRPGVFDALGRPGVFDALGKAYAREQ